MFNTPCLAQATDSAYVTMDTLTFYKVQYSLSKKAGVISYKIEGKEVSKAAFDTIAEANKKRSNCMPCYAQYRNINNQLVYEGIYYYNCGAKADTVKEEVVLNSDIVQQKSVKLSTQSCRHGKWLFYNDNGTIEEKYYHMGEEVL